MALGGIIVRYIKTVRKFLKYRYFKSSYACFDIRSVKQYIEILDLGITMVMVFMGFVGEIIRVDVNDDFPGRGDFLVDKYDTADNNQAHPGG